MSYFTIKNNKIIRKHTSSKKNEDIIEFNDLKNYMNFINNKYKQKKTDNNELYELIEMFSQLNLSKNKLFFDYNVKKNIKDHFTISNDYDTLIIDKLNYNINFNCNLIFKINSILNNTIIEYIYNLILIYDEIIIYNCYVTKLNTFRIYICCINNNNNKHYPNIKAVPKLFISTLKNIYYQIIQNRFYLIKKECDKEDRLNIWKKMYLN